MSDFSDIVYRKVIGSDVLRIYPRALVQIYVTNTTTLVAEVTADENGEWAINSLDTGAYDVKVDGKLVKTLHFVKANHTHRYPETWSFLVSGAVTGDSGEVITRPVYGSDVAGSITQVKIVTSNVDATGNVAVHILRGPRDGALALSIATNSVKTYTINPGSAKKRYMIVDNVPDITVGANQMVTIGIDHTSNTVEGITVWLIFQRDE